MIEGFMLRLLPAILFLAAGCQRTPYQQQSSFAREELTPHAVRQKPATQNRKTLTFRVRLYADQDYRSQVVHWKKKFEVLLGRVNRVLAPGFSIELELESAHPWERKTNSSDHDAVLQELFTLDPGNDVDWVVALITGVPQSETRMHALGFAATYSSHLVLRATNDTEERESLSRQLGAMSDEELEALYAKRKAHKELSVFLHEWGHTLGAIHAPGRKWIMSPEYDPWGSSFGKPNARVVARALEAKHKGWTPAERKALQELYEKKQWDLWSEKDITETIAALKQVRGTPRGRARSSM